MSIQSDQGLSLHSKGSCIHCGLPSGDEKFCCLGCETAYRLIHELGLSAFYSKAEVSLQKVEGSGKFDRLDFFRSEEFRSRYVHRLESGDCEARFSIEGLYCTACIWLVERMARTQQACLQAEVNYSKNELYLKWRDTGPDALLPILKRLSQIGYQVSPLHSDFKKKSMIQKEWIRLGVTGALAAANMHLGLYFLAAHDGSMTPNMARGLGLFSATLSLPVLIFGASCFFRNAFYAIKLKRLHSDLLIAVSLLVAFFFSLYESVQGGVSVYYDSLAMVVFLLLIGRMLTRKTTDYVSKPFQVSATIEKVEGRRITSVYAIAPEDVLVVAKGEQVACDGHLLSAEAWFDQSSVSGESAPVRFLERQLILQGSINRSEEIRIQVSNVYEKSSLIARLEASQKNIVSFRSFRFEELFVLSVLGLSGLPFVLGLEEPISKAIAVLIVACPCALALSRPLVLDHLKKHAQRAGLAILNFERFENLTKSRRVFFDKTGTLTSGALKVKLVSQQWSPQDLKIFYSMVLQSHHPVSRSLAYYLSSQTKAMPDCPRVQEIAGKGLELEWNGYEYRVEAQSSAEKKTTVFKKEAEILAEFELQDELRLEAVEVAQDLKRLNKKVGILSGDAVRAVERVAQTLGLQSNVLALQNPDEKACQLKASDLFVGDGLNDTAAMKAAGFSIGITGGAEACFKTADAYLTKRDLRLIPLLLIEAKKASRLVNVNLLISAVYNVVTISLVLMGAIGPVICAIFMPLSSLSVIAISRSTSFFKC